MKPAKDLFKLQAAVLVLLIAMLACSIPPYYAVPTDPAPYDVYVATTGNDANTCRTLALACRSVTGGVGKAVAGSTIIIGAGTFTESHVMRLSTPMNFRGAGQAATIISSADGGVFQVLSAAGYPVEVHMQDLAIANFVATDSDAILNDAGILVLTRVTIRNNAHDGLVNFGTAMLTDCDVSDNGGIGIFSSATLQVTHSVLRRNASTGITNSGIAVIEAQSLLEQNGRFAIYNFKSTDAAGTHPGTLTINSTSISNNIGIGVLNQGGHVTIGGSAINTNAGVGILHRDGVLLLDNSEVVHNSGRGVDVEDLLPPLDSVAEITRTAIVINGASGLYIDKGVARLTNVTVARNSAGIRVVHGSLTFAYGTVVHNDQWGVQLDNSDAGAELQNSIVALNAAGQDCVQTAARVLQDAASLACGAPEVDPATLLLSPDLELADGAQLYSLQTGSVAIDRAIGACPATDQRGYARPYDGNGDGRAVCDVGAYEFGAGLHLEIATPGVETPTPTLELLIIPTDTATPGAFTLLLGKNANCRRGPGSVYPVLTSFLQGQRLQIDGRSETTPLWWQVVLPNSSQHCWVSDSAGAPDGDPNTLPVIPAPPTPMATVKPDKGGTDFDKDGYPSDVDCDDKNAKVHPGAAETPDDKLDSNCNGDDDK